MNSSAASGPMLTGLREQHKRERRRRIERAAREVFAEKGFAAATTREIALRARVGTATLFAYAPDKATLLAWVFRDDLDRLTASALASLPPDAALLDQLLHIFAPRYAYWARDPRLARQAVAAALTAHLEAAGDEDVDQIATLWPQMREHVSALVADHQRAGRVDATVDPHLAAGLIVAAYTSETHEWLALPQPDVDDALASIRAALQLLVRAFAPVREA